MTSLRADAGNRRFAPSEIPANDGRRIVRKQMKLYNTLTKEKEEFHPLEAGKAGIYA